MAQHVNTKLRKVKYEKYPGSSVGTQDDNHLRRELVVMLIFVTVADLASSRQVPNTCAAFAAATRNKSSALTQLHSFSRLECRVLSIKANTGESKKPAQVSRLENA